MNENEIIPKWDERFTEEYIRKVLSAGQMERGFSH